MYGFGIGALIGVALGFGFGVGCALAVLYGIYMGGYRAALKEAQMEPHPKRYLEQVERLRLKPNA